MESNEADSHNTLGDKDPYNALRKSTEDSIRPDNIPAGQNENADPSPRERAANAAQSAEQAAAGATKAASAATKAGAGNYAGAAKDALGAVNNFKNSTKGKDKSGKGQGVMSGGSLKKATPIIAILLIILVPIIAIGSLLLLPFHILESAKSAFNSLFSSNSTAAPESYAAMLDDTAASGYTKIGSDQCADLANHDIIPNQCEQATDDPDIQAYAQAKILKNSTLATTISATNSAGNFFKWTDRNGQVRIIDTKEEFYELFNNNADFNDAITRGSLAWTGTFSGWFDDMAGRLMSDLNIRRNSFQNFYDEAEKLGDSGAAYRKIVTEINKTATMSYTDRESLRSNNTNDSLRLEELTDGLNAGFIKYTSIEVVGDRYDTVSRDQLKPWNISLYRHNTERNYLKCADGSEYNEECPQVSVASQVIIKTTTSIIVSEEMEKARGRVATYLPEMARSFNQGGNSMTETCAQLYGISYFSIIVSSSRLNQAKDFAMKFLETVDRTRLGYGGESPIHEFSQTLSESGTYEYIGEGDTLANRSRSEVERPALNSQGLSWVTTNSAVDLNDPSVLKLSLEGIAKGFILEAVDVVSCSTTTLLGGVLHGFISLIRGSNSFFSDSQGARVVTGDLLDMAIDRAAFALMFNPCASDEDDRLAPGEDVGNCVALGSHYYLSKNHQAGGGSPGDEAKVREFFAQQRVVIAKQAELERSRLSPFDASSQYTFLGSIVHQILPYAATLTNSSLFTSIGSIVGNSINALLPTASAISEDTLSSNIGNCYYLGSGTYAGDSAGINATGDAFCIPYMILDLSPKNMPDRSDRSPQAVEEKVREYEGFSGVDENGNPIIKSDSNLARYITFCSQRLSSFGIIDSNILSNFVDMQIRGNVFLSILRFLAPAAAREAVTIGDNSRAMNWATGQYCVATDDDSINPMWGEMQYYQYYMLYQRINVNRGGLARNNTIPILNDYREANPAPETDDELAAAISGLPVEDYLSLKNYIAYQATDKSTFGPSVANYNHSLQLRPNIIPLTDWILDVVAPIFTTPDTINHRTQGITA